MGFAFGRHDPPGGSARDCFAGHRRSAVQGPFLVIQQATEFAVFRRPIGLVGGNVTRVGSGTLPFDAEPKLPLGSETVDSVSGPWWAILFLATIAIAFVQQAIDHEPIAFAFVQQAIDHATVARSTIAQSTVDDRTVDPQAIHQRAYGHETVHNQAVDQHTVDHEAFDRSAFHHEAVLPSNFGAFLVADSTERIQRVSRHSDNAIATDGARPRAPLVPQARFDVASAVDAFDAWTLGDGNFAIQPNRSVAIQRAGQFSARSDSVPNVAVKR